LYKIYWLIASFSLAKEAGKGSKKFDDLMIAGCRIVAYPAGRTGGGRAAKPNPTLTHWAGLWQAFSLTTIGDTLQQHKTEHKHQSFVLGLLLSKNV
jgi:hypothetical protein